MNKREICKYNILRIVYISQYWYCKFDEFSMSHFQSCVIFGCLIWQKENCETPNKKIDWVWVKNMICKISKIWSIYRKIFNVLLTLKFWRVLDVMFSMNFWLFFDVMFSTSNWRRFFRCSTSSTKFNVFSTLVQRRMPAGRQQKNCLLVGLYLSFFSHVPWL